MQPRRPQGTKQEAKKDNLFFVSSFAPSRLRGRIFYRPAREAAIFLTALFPLASCDKPAPPSSQPISNTIASTVPAATELLIGMGAKDRLVAVSNYEVDKT